MSDLMRPPSLDDIEEMQAAWVLDAVEALKARAQEDTKAARLCAVAGLLFPGVFEDPEA